MQQNTQFYRNNFDKKHLTYKHNEILLDHLLTVHNGVTLAT